jgi:hypothetical protein
MNCLLSLEHWDLGFESHSMLGCMCVRLFCVCVGSGRATSWSPVQGVLPTVLGLRHWSETKRFTDALCSEVGATGKRESERDSPLTYVFWTRRIFYLERSQETHSDVVLFVSDILYLPWLVTRYISGKCLWWLDKRYSYFQKSSGDYVADHSDRAV